MLVCRTQCRLVCGKVPYLQTDRLINRIVGAGDA